jgi:CRP-like cAMP-binding protein
MIETLTLIEKTAFLKSIPMLSTIPTESLADVAARASEIHCDPGQAIYHEGDPNRGAFLVVSGLLELRKGRASVRIVQPGMSIGELWLGEGEPHQYTLAALDHSHVLHIAREDVEETILEYPEFGLAMVRMLSHRAHELTTRVLDLERLVARMHAAMAKAGLEPPEPGASGPIGQEIPRPRDDAERPW